METTVRSFLSCVAPTCVLETAPRYAEDRIPGHVRTEKCGWVFVSAEEPAGAIGTSVDHVEPISLAVLGCDEHFVTSHTNTVAGSVPHHPLDFDMADLAVAAGV